MDSIVFMKQMDECCSVLLSLRISGGHVRGEINNPSAIYFPVENGFVTHLYSSLWGRYIETVLQALRHLSGGKGSFLHKEMGWLWDVQVRAVPGTRAGVGIRSWAHILASIG